MFVLLLMCAALSVSNGANIVGYFMMPSYSHQIVFQPIWKELSKRGHNVTILTPNPLNDPTLTNLTEIDLSFSYQLFKNLTSAMMGGKRHSIVQGLETLGKASMITARTQLLHPSVQKFLNDSRNQHFDLFLVEFLWPQMYALKDVFNCPMVGITSMSLTTTSSMSIGNPQHPVLDPDFLLPFSTKLSLPQRIISSLATVFFQFSTYSAIHKEIDQISRELLGVNRPAIEIASEVSLILVNANPALTKVKPKVPAYVDISGLHIQEKKPLPKNLQKYLDDAKEGVVYFSLGSNMKSDTLPADKLKKLTDVFARLPYKVLWKFENEQLPGKPANVEIRKWLPQQDILGHPNVKLFFTQGGIQSLDEALNNEVPVLAMPFFGDQIYNAHHVVAEGFGLSVNFHDFTEEELLQKIDEVITNKKYKERARYLNQLANDQPMKPLDKAIWWIEYVIRHKGASHLRYKALDLPWYQYLLLDVIASVIAIVGVALYILIKSVKLLISLATFLFTTKQTKHKKHRD